MNQLLEFYSLHLILCPILISVSSSIPSNFLSHFYAVCHSFLLCLSTYMLFSGLSTLMSFSNVLPIYILLWTLPSFIHILLCFSNPKFILMSLLIAFTIIICIILFSPITWDGHLLVSPDLNKRSKWYTPTLYEWCVPCSVYYCSLLYCGQWVTWEQLDRVCAQLHFNIWKEIGVKLDKEHWYEHAWKLIETSHDGKVIMLCNQHVQTSRIHDKGKETCVNRRLQFQETDV